jgi:hypothetical protein
MAKTTAQQEEKKRLKVQVTFWNVVGLAEHINLPKLEDALKKEFHTDDDRLIEAQIRLMKNEGRIKVESNAKVWIKQPPMQQP